MICHFFRCFFFLTKACDKGLFGDNCSETCGHCRDNKCSNFNGTCITGCDAGYQGDLCKISKSLRLTLYNIMFIFYFSKQRLCKTLRSLLCQNNNHKHTTFFSLKVIIQLMISGCIFSFEVMVDLIYHFVVLYWLVGGLNRKSNIFLTFHLNSYEKYS